MHYKKATEPTEITEIRDGIPESYKIMYTDLNPFVNLTRIHSDLYTVAIY